MKKSEEDRLKYVVYESTLALPKKEANPASLRSAAPSKGRGLVWILPPSSGRRCPEGAEVGWGKRDEKERGSSQVDDSRKHPLQENSL